MRAAPGRSNSPHVQQKRAKRRAEILHAALAAFREHGFHATSLDDIAARLGMRKTAIYHYFADKDALLFECHRESLAELERIIEESKRCCQVPSERLAYLVREHVRIMTNTVVEPVTAVVGAAAVLAVQPLLGGLSRPPPGGAWPGRGHCG